jgi:phosphohistidine phosphatase SixA
VKRGQGSITFLLVCLIVMLLLGSTRAVHGQRSDATLDKRALIHVLQKGGYVLYFRHAITDRTQIDADRVHLPNCTTQRNLSAEGQKQARAIGKAVQTLGITIAEVLTSPYCRCIDTAKLAFGKFTVVADLVWTLGQSEAETQRRTEALRKLLGTQPPKGTNTVLVSHTANLKEAMGLWPEPEGVMYIFQPREDGSVFYLGNIGPEEWMALTPITE